MDTYIDLVKSIPDIKKKCEDKMIALSKESLKLQAQAAQKLVVKCDLLEEAGKTMAAEIIDLDIENEGLREQIGGEVDEKRLSAYIKQEKSSSEKLDDRSDRVKARLTARLAQAHNLVVPSPTNKPVTKK
jgi:hypothetical protein